MNTFGYSCCYSNSSPKPPKATQSDKIGNLLRSLDAELANFVPENANPTFVLAIHSCRLAVRALKKFF